MSKSIGFDAHISVQWYTQTLCCTNQTIFIQNQQIPILSHLHWIPKRKLSVKNRKIVKEFKEDPFTIKEDPTIGFPWAQSTYVKALFLQNYLVIINVSIFLWFLWSQLCFDDRVCSYHKVAHLYEEQCAFVCGQVYTEDKHGAALSFNFGRFSHRLFS